LERKIFEENQKLENANTQLVSLLEELKKTQLQLFQSEKMASIGQLAAGIAHEIRNPLTSISLLVHSLDGRLSKNNESDAPDFVLLQEEISRLNNIITQFLEYAKPATPQLERINLNEVLAGAKGLLLPKFNAKKLQWKEELAPDLPLVRADKFQIQQVIINMALNALAAMEQKGSALMLRTFQHDVHVMVQFTDDGPGIKKEDLRKLFVPFFTTKASGLGLGLSISQRIIASHSGSIEATSKFGYGAQFTIRLPL